MKRSDFLKTLLGAPLIVKAAASVQPATFPVKAPLRSEPPVPKKEEYMDVPISGRGLWGIDPSGYVMYYPR